jgi:cytochrome c oxidase cbb3-type subunit 4
MKAILTAHNLASGLVTTFWTPLFVGLFIAIVAYALWPRHRAKFEDAARIPLRED